MTQVVKGLDSACVCPECGYACKACLGGLKGANAPLKKGMTKEEWEFTLSRRNAQAKE
jgi:hypothetical protein